MSVLLVQDASRRWWAAEADVDNRELIEVRLSGSIVKALNSPEANPSPSRGGLLKVAVLLVVNALSPLEPPQPSATFHRWDKSQGRWVRELPTNWSGKKIALILHGMLSDLGGVQDMARNVAATGYYDEIWGVEYEWRASIAASGELFAQRVASVNGIASVNLLDIHAHSMGGLVARYALEESPHRSQLPVFRLFTYGTPHQGVPRDAVLNLGLVVTERGAAAVGLNAIRWEGPRDLLNDSQFVRRINADSSGRSRAAYLTFAGDDFLGFYGGIPHWFIYGEDEASDGIVSVRSASPACVDPIRNSDDPAGINLMRSNCAYYANATRELPLPYNHSGIKSPEGLQVSLSVSVR